MLNDVMAYNEIIITAAIVRMKALRQLLITTFLWQHLIRWNVQRHSLCNILKVASRICC
jgi:hypothetical protein